MLWQISLLTKVADGKVLDGNYKLANLMILFMTRVKLKIYVLRLVQLTKNVFDMAKPNDICLRHG